LYEAGCCLKNRFNHRWNVNAKEALKIQERLAKKVRISNGLSRLDLIGGADVAYSQTKTFAVVIVLDFKSLKVVARSFGVAPLVFPYIPGLLSFREGPALLRAFEGLKVDPDLVIFDGQGVAHPRGLGVAAHMGVLLDMPTIGCAKSKLIGEYEEPGAERGRYSSLWIGGKESGVVLRTKKGVRPVFVSPGHLVDIPTSASIVLKVCQGYRLPEPTRQAHIEVEKFKKADEAMRC